MADPLSGSPVAPPVDVSPFPVAVDPGSAAVSVALASPEFGGSCRFGLIRVRARKEDEDGIVEGIVVNVSK